MSQLTNSEFADRLRALASIYDATQDQDVARPRLGISATTKAGLLATMRAVGGKFTKRYWGKEYNGAGGYLTVYSQSLPDLEITIPRDSVCERIVTYNCTPLLGPEDEAEVDSAALGAA